MNVVRYVTFSLFGTTGRLAVRDDLVAGWQFHRGHGLLLLLGQDMIDYEIKETREEFLAIMEGKDGVQVCKDKSVCVSSNKDLSKVSPGRKGQRRGCGGHHAPRVSGEDGIHTYQRVEFVDSNPPSEPGTQGASGGSGEPDQHSPDGVERLPSIPGLPAETPERTPTEDVTPPGTVS